jgi:hypothetical protein
MIPEEKAISIFIFLIMVIITLIILWYVDHTN